MAYSSFDTKEINAKIVYFGAQSSGKSENLRAIHQKLISGEKDLQKRDGAVAARPAIADVSIDQQVFEFLPVAVGKVKDFDVRMHLYTLPCLDSYANLEQVILKGIDGAVFVVDSRVSSLNDNLEAIKQMEQKLAEQGITITDIPVVFQFNHRDDKDAISTETLKVEFSKSDLPVVEAVASRSEGTLETFNLVTGQVLKKLGHMA